MKINITQKHVDKYYEECTSRAIIACCPTTQCLKEMFPEAKFVATYLSYARVDHNKYNIHHELRQSITDFDKTGVFRCGEYELTSTESLLL